jgi:hypothetical protein
MMLGIVFTILGMILTVYVPIWAKGLESQHMEGVANSFTDLKSTVDTQIAQGDVGTKMSTRIKLGTEGGPLLGLGQSTGGISFEPDNSMMRIYNTDDTFEKYGAGRGRVIFDSNNIYYVDQEYIYENGAVILDQTGSNLMKTEPNALPGTGRNLTLSYNTSYPVVWHQYFTDILANRSGLDPSEYDIPAPTVIGDPDKELWMVRVSIRDVNKLTTTLSYIDVGIN